jgi:hypothetical protein
VHQLDLQAIKKLELVVLVVSALVVEREKTGDSAGWGARLARERDTAPSSERVEQKGTWCTF